MARPSACPDCRGRMEEGFLPDNTQQGAVPAGWHPGKPEKTKFLGLELGTKVTRTEIRPVRAWRCSSCKLLRLYAE